MTTEQIIALGGASDKGTKVPGGTRTETISEKAVRLFRAGRVRHIKGDQYEVVGDSGTYTVDLYRDGCNCPAGENHQPCSHEQAAEIAQAKLNAATARRLKELRSRRPDRITFPADQVMANIERMGA